VRLPTSVLLTLVSCLLASAANAEQPPQRKDIPVVKTWGDLFDAEPIDVGGQKVRVGIEADSFPAGAGVLVYCLTDEPPANPKGSDFETVGPVSVQVVAEGGQDMESRAAQMMTKRQRMAGPRLYVGVVAYGSSGRLTVTVRPDAGEDRPVVAQREVKVKGEPYHGWTRLVPAGPPQAPRAGADEADRIPFVRHSSTMCVPHRDGLHPFAFGGMDVDRRVRRERTDALPTLFPREAGPGLRLTFDGTSATVESETPFSGARPEEGLLVRWWMNGKPVIPSPLAQQMQQMQQTRQMAREGAGKLRLRLEWDPADIGARRGDTVRAQLLFSPDGVRLVPHPQVMLSHPIAASGDADYVSRMTDTAEFVVP
jgi:hypothetical protein